MRRCLRAWLGAPGSAIVFLSFQKTVLYASIFLIRIVELISKLALRLAAQFLFYYICAYIDWAICQGGKYRKQENHRKNNISHYLSYWYFRRRYSSEMSFFYEGFLIGYWRMNILESSRS